MRLTAPLLTIAFSAAAALASPAVPLNSSSPTSLPSTPSLLPGPQLHTPLLTFDTSLQNFTLTTSIPYTSTPAIPPSSLSSLFTTLVSTIDSPATPLVPSVFTITSPDGILFALTLTPAVSLDWAELHAAVGGWQSRLALEETSSVASGGGGWYGELKDTPGSIVGGFIITSGAVGALTGGIEYTDGTAETATADLGVPPITPDPHLATDRPLEAEGVSGL